MSCRNEVGFPGVPDLIGPRTFTIAQVDADRDGRPDLVVAPIVNGASDQTVQLYRNLGARRFADPVSFPAGLAVERVSIGDVDGDLVGDVVVTGAGGSTTVLRGNGSGGFAAPTTPQAMGFDDLALADVDGDLRADAISIGLLGMVCVRTGTASGSFGAATCTSTDLIEPGTVAVGDLDGDGLPDVVAGEDQSRGWISVLHNASGGALSVAGTYPCGDRIEAIALADVDADGDLDVLAAGYSSLIVLLNAGDGTLGAPVLYANGSWNVSLAVGDFDGDGRPDAAMGKWSDPRSVDVFVNAGDGTFLAPQAYYDAGAAEIASADLDGDRRIDLAAASSAGLGVHLLWNSGGAFLQPIPSPAPTSPEHLVLGDVDGDGVLDAVAGDPARGQVAVLHGVGDGTFALAQTVDGGGRVAVADLDADGDADVLCDVNVAGNPTLRVYRSDGGTLVASQDLAGISAWPLAIADLDGDGVPDLFASRHVNQSEEAVWLRGRGDATFDAPVVLASLSGYRTLMQGAAGDLDRNGWADVVARDASGMVHLWRNLGGGSFVHLEFDANAPDDLALGDLDGDGILDLAVVHRHDETVALHRGAGDGTFLTSVSIPYAMAQRVAIGAPAGRARNVMLVRSSMSEDVGLVEVLPGGGLSLVGRWSTLGGMIGEVPFAVGDVDGDLRPDLVLGGIDGIAVRVSACRP